jgi:hypothetical protein
MKRYTPSADNSSVIIRFDRAYSAVRKELP